jgi:hypothetical protein
MGAGLPPVTNPGGMQVIATMHDAAHPAADVPIMVDIARPLRTNLRREEALTLAAQMSAGADRGAIVAFNNPRGYYSWGIFQALRSGAESSSGRVPLHVEGADAASLRLTSVPTGVGSIEVVDGATMISRAPA